MDFTVLLATGVGAFTITSVLGIWLIPFLRRVKYGQTILDIGPAWHKKKQGTPTMGGIMFIAGILVASAAGYGLLTARRTVPGNPMSIFRFWMGLVMALAFGAVGFLDDYLKVVRKQNEGLTPRQKSFLQLLVAVAYLTGLYLAGDRSTVVIIPFLGQLDLGLFYYVLMLIAIVGTVNAVNLTDGIDGLAASVTLIVAAACMVMSALLGFKEMNILATALAGGCAGFLVWNFYPAKVFMGDTGSLFLGGMVVALAFGMGLPLFLVLLGVVYIMETASVIIQVTSFKLTGKRVFKMSPIHHHFEMSGYSEVRIVALFGAIALVGCLLAVLAVLRM